MSPRGPCRPAVATDQASRALTARIDAKSCVHAALLASLISRLRKQQAPPSMARGWGGRERLTRLEGGAGAAEEGEGEGEAGSGQREGGARA